MIPIISWKNIWRNRLRSLVVIGALVLGVFGGLFTTAFMSGMTERRVSEALSTEMTHIQIHHPDYMDNPELQFYIDETDLVVSFLSTLEGVQEVATRSKIVSMIASSSANSGVTVLGIDPVKETKVSDMEHTLLTEEEVQDQFDKTSDEEINQFIKDSVGAYFEGVSRNPILIGEELAETLEVKVRSKLVLTFQDREGNLTGGSFRVCGIFRTENSAFEESQVFVRAEDLSALSLLPVNKAHEIAVTVEDADEIDAVLTPLQEQFPHLDIQSWTTLKPDVAMMDGMMDFLLYIIMIIVLLALGFGIVNTMLMVVMERVKELGMLMAIGMNKVRVFMMIILESVLLSLTGGMIGIAISVIVISISNHYGIDLTVLVQEGFEAMGFAAVFYPSLTVDAYITVTIFVIITGVLASVYPALRALKLNPVEALRTE